MSRVIVLSVIEQGLTPTEAATKFGVSRQWVNQLLHRYRDGGLDAVEARSHRPTANPRQTPRELAGRVIALRQTLTAQGLDAGPLTIGWHLHQQTVRTRGRAPEHRTSQSATRWPCWGGGRRRPFRAWSPEERRRAAIEDR